MHEPDLEADLALHFQQQSISSLLSSLKRSTLSIHNRLRSIRADARFVQLAADAYQQPESRTSSSRRRRRRPLVANERCGSWYVPPGDKAASAYFKSTDGHERAWKFSTRRLNLHLVDLIERNDGIVIVDSTRRGKRMPDALSTTIPIWCAVLNRVLLPHHPDSSRLFLPPHLLRTTHAQIEALLPAFAASLRALDLSSLPTCLSKPLRPFWVTQDSVLPSDDQGGVIFDDFRPVICCTASRRVVGATEADTQGYIQGAGDDTENWAHGLTAELFWKHEETLLRTPESDLPALIEELIAAARAEQSGDSPLTQLAPSIFVCALPAPAGIASCVVSLTSAPWAPKESWVASKTHIEIPLGRSKAASRNLRLALPVICEFASESMQMGNDVVVACESGKDLSVGAALAVLCYLFDKEGNFRGIPDGETFTKDGVKKKLGVIMTAYPAANPSRNTLQSVNSFLMGREGS